MKPQSITFLLMLLTIVSFQQIAAQKPIGNKPLVKKTIAKKVAPQKIKDTIKTVIETPLADTAIIYHEGGLYTLYISELEKGTIFFMDFRDDNNHRSVTELNARTQKQDIKYALMKYKKGMAIGFYSLYNKAGIIPEMTLKLTEAPKLLFHVPNVKVQ